MHIVRWILTSAWLLLITSLFFDPLSPWLTEPNNRLSPLRLDPTACIQVQGVCLEERPYALGTTIFWAIIVPSSIFILLIFGHEVWRRICPLSFLSQIPRALGWQRQIQRVNPQTGKVRYEFAKVKPGSWLGRNYLYLQFGLLYLGLCARILFINSNRLALAVWFIVTILAAIAVGYLYGGKSWCNYFCPMAPVQKVYAEPRALLASQAHVGDQLITQSMCRTVVKDRKEQSACVACQTPCIDIDSERSYWDGILQPSRRFLYYCYAGLVVGYFGYYYLYAGNWAYYFSGAWARQEDQLDTLFNPGFYLFNTPIPIPKLIAVPLTLALFSAGGYLLGRYLETQYKAYLQRSKQALNPELLQHRMFALCTFVVFNIFFIFGGRPLILLLPLSLQFLYEGVLIGLSTLWLCRTWQRHPDLYARESLASRLRRQLNRLQLNVSQFLEGRSLADLTTDEVYVLAKVLPGFTKEKRHQAYKGVLRESLEEGYINTSSSLEVLQQMRSELDISDEEHRLILEELGVEDPELLDPHRQRSRENLVRLGGYRRALERLLSFQQYQAVQTGVKVMDKKTMHDLLTKEPESIQRLGQEYSVNLREEEEILGTLDPEAMVLRRADVLLDRLDILIQRYHGLNQPILHKWEAVLTLLCSTVRQKKRLLVIGLLEILEHLDHQPTSLKIKEAPAFDIARSLGKLSPTVLQDLLEESTLDSSARWQQRLSPQILALLTQPSETAPACSLELSVGEIATHLEALVFEPNPLIQAVSLFMVFQLDPKRGRERAKNLLAAQTKLSRLVQEVTATLLDSSTTPDLGLVPFKTLEKVVYLYNSDFFSGVQAETLIQLADRAVIKVCAANAVITEEGDTCRELLLLIEGSAQIQQAQHNQLILSQDLLPNQVLDELEVLAHTHQSSTIVAKATPTRLLAIPVDTFDDLLARDGDLARRVLEMESCRLQQLIGQSQVKV